MGSKDFGFYVCYANFPYEYKQGKMYPNLRSYRESVKSSMLEIDYESESFPSGRLAKPNGTLQVTWDDILWSAITVGRPPTYHVFQHENPSIYEAIFRISLVRMALEQRGVRRQRLWMTDAFKHLDPTEKGAVNYFLGMTFCKLFSSKMLGTPWLLHLDIFKNQLNAQTLKGRSRPDFIGLQNDTQEWHAFESKGRSSAMSAEDKKKAKAQANRLVSVDGQSCSLHIASATYFKNNKLHFYWRDPEPEVSQKFKDIRIVDADKGWRVYYEAVQQLIVERGDAISENDPKVYLKEVDVEIAIAPEILIPLREGNWKEVRTISMIRKYDHLQREYRVDGLRIKAGERWHERLSMDS